jgi:hypothetical protein
MVRRRGSGESVHGIDGAAPPPPRASSATTAPRRRYARGALCARRMNVPGEVARELSNVSEGARLSRGQTPLEWAGRRPMQYRTWPLIQGPWPIYTVSAHLNTVRVSSLAAVVRLLCLILAPPAGTDNVGASRCSCGCAAFDPTPIAPALRCRRLVTGHHHDCLSRPWLSHGRTIMRTRKLRPPRTMPRRRFRPEQHHQHAGLQASARCSVGAGPRPCRTGSRLGGH